MLKMIGKLLAWTLFMVLMVALVSVMAAAAWTDYPHNFPYPLMVAGWGLVLIVWLVGVWMIWIGSDWDRNAGGSDYSSTGVTRVDMGPIEKARHDDPVPPR